MRILPQFLSPQQVFVPPHLWLAEALADTSKEWPMVKGTAHDDERENFLVDIVRICPIPPFLVLDGFDADLDIRVVLRRLDQLTDKRPVWFKHAHQFLRACTLQPKANTIGTSLTSEFWSQRACADTREWCARRSFMLCPQLQQPHATVYPQAPHPPQDMAALFRQFLDMQRQATADHSTTTHEEKKDDATTTTLGMAPSELKRLLTMCGLEEGQEDFLPSFYADLAEPGLSKEGKNLIIREACRRHPKYDDAPIPLLAPLLKTIRTKEWSGDSGVTTLVSAVKGLSPFLVLELSEEDEATWNEQFELMEQATLYSVDELKTTTKLEAKVPSGFHDLRQCMKAFANLLFALFGAMCPLLVQLQELISAMGQFTSHQRAGMLQKNRAAIMWILFLQTREFTAGKMILGQQDTHLAAFTQLRFDILAGKEVTNTSVPWGLLDTTSATKRRQTETTTETPEPPKKKVRTCTTHPSLTKAFGPIFAANPTVSLKAMCEACNVKVTQLFPNDSRRCVLAALKGECSYATCRNKHGFTVTEGEAAHIIKLLDPVIQNPSKVSKVSK